MDLYLGDCRDILPMLHIDPIDLVLTDPPYGASYTGYSGRANPGVVRADGARQGMRVARQALFAALQFTAPDAHVLVFCSWESWPDFYDAVSPLWPPKNALVWHKDRGGMGNTRLAYAPDYEVILYATAGGRALAGRRDGAVITGYPPVPYQQRRHLTEKPTDLLAYLIGRHCPPGGLVVDPFAGSGSTLEAARRTGRRAVGVEIDEGHCAQAAARLAAGEEP